MARSRSLQLDTLQSKSTTSLTLLGTLKGKRWKLHSGESR